MSILERYRRVSDRVAEATVRSGRELGAVTLVVACKTFPAEVVREVVDAGATEIGENYVQEARSKRAALSGVAARWHLIGRLQRNKARIAARIFDLVHSIDSLPVAAALDRVLDRRLSCLVQVNLDGERSKVGVPPGEVEDFCGQIRQLPNLSLEGLMALPARTDSAGARRAFAALRELRDRLRLHGVRLKDLSMGMSGDFEEAILEGATIVRVGNAILGPRAG